ncbi:PDZ and LIM domain protein 5a isoform X1 [Hemiscyllium ocellatum]|uniref:PDZ and LIM domain protein 5a isoform X1 n=1 Tax=Hemiscyllium ocellatum TaxID=170820 RepID=UPI002965D38F|nr:PDZ and LIM domain protein 5a isoform X1 [Hemiscyllium ocellatum]XP_060707739.1 PDZ and LIM domain protein 5a isoform X1 [Hemiscyllium ocellatum]
MSNYTVCLQGPAPWGFRLQGGKDFNMPLTISRLTEGGKAARASIEVGDVLLSIDGLSTDGMTHMAAQNKIKACTGSLSLNLQRAAPAPKPAGTTVQKDELQEVTHPVPVASVAPLMSKVPSAPSSAYNMTARPFGASSSPKVTPTSASSQPAAFSPASSPLTQPLPPSPASTLNNSAPPPSVPVASPPQTHASFKPGVNGRTPPVTTAKPTVTSSVNVPWQPKVYNTPINLYSSDNAHEVAEGQKRGLREGQSDAKQQNGSTRRYMASVQPDVHYHHNLSDQSKKRLMQDTEDWQPKTGLAQSRSFCILAQMTGTEHMGETTPASETSKKTSGDAVDVPQPIGPATASVKPMSKMPSGVCHTSPVAAVSSPTFKPSGVAGSTRPAGWQAANSAANSSPRTVLPTAQVSPASQPGWGSGSKAASIAVSKSEPQDDDTLVQMAEHIPAGNRTPMCAHCNSIIRGPFLVAMGRSWHPEEFTCAYCNLSLAHIGFVEEKGSVYCEKCYEQFFAPECARCQRKILGEIINALKQTWHVNCFVCVACKQPIRNNIFHMEDGDPYCEKDYYNLFGTSCHGCDFPIEAGDKFLQALGHTWHDTCFVCAVCCANLEGQTFFSKKDKLLCKKHAHTVNI